MSDPRQQPPVYLDNAATTRTLPRVAEAMTRALCEDFGNPSSRHKIGLQAEQQLQRARVRVARPLGVEPGQLLFTSGGTEANALALLGLCQRQRHAGHLLVSAVEHPSVLGTAALIRQRTEVEVETIPVTGGGWVDPEQVLRMLRPETFGVAVMHVNNETGVEQPVADIARAVRARRGDDCKVLVDAVQSLNLLDTSLARLGAQLVTASAHKVHGPMGVGCLALADGLHLPALWGGGDQERGRRPGTENVAGAVGFGAAVDLAAPDAAAMARQTERLIQALVERLPGAALVGDAGRRAPHIACVAVPGLPSEVLVNMLEAAGVCVSSGAACHARSSLHSHVLEAMGLPRDLGVIRLSVSSCTTDEEVARAVEAIAGLAI